MNAREIGLMWVKYYNDHDIDGILSLYDVALVNMQHPWGREVVGKANMREVYRRIFQSFPVINIEAVRVVSDDQSLVVQWKFGGTMEGDFAGQGPTGKRFAICGCEVFRIDNGKIVRQEGYWDKATMFAQLGLKI